MTLLVGNTTIAMNSTPTNSTPVFNQSGGHSFDPVFDTFMILLAVLILGINGLVICLFIWKSFLKETTNFFLVSLAVSDGLTGLIVIPLYLACAISYARVDYCFSFDMMHRLTAFATVYHLLLITCDRYVAITRPFRHSSTFTPGVAYALLVVVWAIASFLPLIQLAWYDPYNLRDASPEIRRYELHYNITCAVIAFILPVVVMMLAYAEMLRIVTRHARAIEATTREKQILTKERRAMAIFASMLIVYIVCWFSFFFFALNDDLDGKSFQIPRELYRIFLFLRFSTSIFNPILYVFFKTDFKKALREILKHYECRAAVTGFLLQNYSVSNNDDDDSSPRAAPRTNVSRTRS